MTQTPKGSLHIQKGVQARLWPFLRLDKSQHSSGTCETGSHLPKGVISLTSGRRDIWLPTGQAFSVPQLPITHFKVHASSHPSKTPSSLQASPPSATHSPYNPANLAKLPLLPALSSSLSFPQSRISSSLLCFLGCPFTDSTGIQPSRKTDRCRHWGHALGAMKSEEVR